MKLFFVTAVMAVFAAAPGVVASSSRGVDNYDSEHSSSFDEEPQDFTSSANANENKMMDFLKNPNNPNCDGIGPNTCDNRVACVWTCSTRNKSDKHRGCCEYRRNKQPALRPPTPRPPTPTRRPTPSSSGSPLDNGLLAGRSEANRLWRNAGNTCSAAWSDFPNSVDRRIRNKGWNVNTGNWRQRSFNQGARDGMKQIVTQKEKECFHDTADECVDLGDEAARIIAYNHCGGGVGTTSVSSWRRECRDAAVDQCEARIFNEVRNRCGSPSTSDLTMLKNKCWNQVLTMIGDRSEVKDQDYFEAY